MTPNPASVPTYEIIGTVACFRPIGTTSPNHLIQTLQSAMVACQGAGYKKLLFNTTNLTGPEFSNFDRLETSLRIMTFWDRSIKLALVFPTTPGEFVTALARQQGLIVNLFNAEAPALTWLG
jgi:hypothetical protein